MPPYQVRGRLIKSGMTELPYLVAGLIAAIRDIGHERLTKKSWTQALKESIVIDPKSEPP